MSPTNVLSLRNIDDNSAPLVLPISTSQAVDIALFSNSAANLSGSFAVDLRRNRSTDPHCCAFVVGHLGALGSGPVGLLADSGFVREGVGGTEDVCGVGGTAGGFADDKGVELSLFESAISLERGVEVDDAGVSDGSGDNEGHGGVGEDEKSSEGGEELHGDYYLVEIVNWSFWCERNEVFWRKECCA